MERRCWCCCSGVDRPPYGKTPKATEYMSTRISTKHRGFLPDEQLTSHHAERDIKVDQKLLQPLNFLGGTLSEARRAEILHTARPSVGCKGCANSATTLQCPTCLKLSINDSYFCSQDCFKNNRVGQVWSHERNALSKQLPTLLRY